jgi:dUTP pyrophosphatase
MIALAIPRSTLLRSGATLFTAVWDPGCEGRGEGLLVVFNPYGVEIERRAQIAQLVFIRLDRETKFVYRGSYQRENI